jgi:DNA-binding response OmpR family regulator
MTATLKRKALLLHLCHDGLVESREKYFVNTPRYVAGYLAVRRCLIKRHKSAISALRHPDTQTVSIDLRAACDEYVVWSCKCTSVNTMKTSVRLDGLLCCNDEQVLGFVKPALESFSIETQVTTTLNTVLEAVNHRRLDLIVADWNVSSTPVRVLRATRNSSWNANTTIMGIVSSDLEMQAALRAGANFLIHRSAGFDSVTRCLRAAYGTMLLQRRRAARVPVDIPVVAKFSDVGRVEAKISDISVGGLALHCRQPIPVQSQATVHFVLPFSEILIHAVGRVVNADQNGRAGICFSFIPEQERKFLESWLTIQLAKLEDAEIPSGTSRNRAN